jgi:transcriptional regulator with XRE-family HTH domain
LTCSGGGNPCRAETHYGQFKLTLQGIIVEEVGERLAEERKRLGKTVAGMADECGVSKQAQINFEKGRQLPGGAYLIATAALGVDIAYVLTGQRSGGLPPMSQTAFTPPRRRYRRTSRRRLAPSRLLPAGATARRHEPANGPAHGRPTRSLSL